MNYELYNDMYNIDIYTKDFSYNVTIYNNNDYNQYTN